MSRIKADKTQTEKAWWELHKNAKKYSEKILKTKLCRGVSLFQRLSCGPVDWGVEYTDCSSVEGYISPKECPVAQSARAVKYTDCIFAEGKASPKECIVNLSTGVVEYTDCISEER